MTPHLLHIQSRVRGFTLLELMVVLVLVSVLVTFAMLSVSSGIGSSPLKDISRRLLTVMQLASEEAILFNKSLGLKFEDNRYSFYELIVPEPAEQSPDTTLANNPNLPSAAGSKPATQSKPKPVWEPVQKAEEEQRDVFSSTDLPEDYRFDIYIDGNRISLDEDPFKLADTKKKPKIKPTIFITPDGEIFPSFTISIQHDDSDSSASITMNEDGELELTLEEGDAL